MAVISSSFAAAGGIASLGISWQALLFQLITFLLVLGILKKFAYGPLVKSLDGRRQAVEDSLDDAKATADKLAQTNAETAKLLATARQEADAIVAIAKKESASLVEEATKKAEKRAKHLVESAQAELEQDVTKARASLQKDTIELIAKATGIVLKQKVDAKADAALIESALKESR